MVQSLSTGGHLPVDDHLGEPLGERRLADAGLADVERIVLAPPAQHLDGALDLGLAPDQRIDPALRRAAVEVRGVVLERAAGRLRPRPPRPRRRAAPVAAALAELREPVGDEIDDVEPGHVVQAEQIDGVGLLLAEDRDQHVLALDLLLAARLDVKDGALQHALESERRLHVLVALALEARRGLVDELLQLPAQAVQVGAAGLEDLRDGGNVQDGQQQVLDRHVLVAVGAGLLEGLVETVFEFAA